ncbi:HNH endonuclease [Candidatus Daviesbacteria bacterium]|nr:HNH endonuclease [Candidatus Daviesbacteria bacterium]
MRKCTRCQKEKSLEEFNYKVKSKDLRQYHCKDCSRLYVRSHYERNREYYLVKAHRRNQKIRREIRNYVWRYLTNHPCIDCGETDPIVLEFDHIKDKSFTISSVGRDKRLAEVQNEIEKCEVRCANCHRRKTALQFSWNKNYLPL